MNGWGDLIFGVARGGGIQKSPAAAGIPSRAGTGLFGEKEKAPGRFPSACCLIDRALCRFLCGALFAGILLLRFLLGTLCKKFLLNKLANLLHIDVMALGGGD